MASKKIKKLLINWEGVKTVLKGVGGGRMAGFLFKQKGGPRPCKIIVLKKNLVM
jgi:hypothetical protein